MTPSQFVQVVARKCLGTEKISALSSTVPASLTVPDGALVAEIQADGATVRCRLDGGVPTASTGWRIDDGFFRTVDSALEDVRLLAQSATTTNVQIVYFDRV